MIDQPHRQRSRPAAGAAPATRPWAALLLLSALAVPAIAQTPAATTATDDVVEGPQYAIPPGREEVLSAMFGAGAVLPGGCKFAGGGVQRSRVEATYDCGGERVVFQLVHPERAPAGAVTTDKFAISAAPAAPDDLTAALVERVRAGEGDFEWVWMGSTEAAANQPIPTWMFEVALIGLVAVAALGFALRRRSRSGAG